MSTPLPTPLPPARPTHPPLTEDEARHVWRRAAELHLAATHRTSDVGRPSGTVTLEAVREAAEGAGIAPEWVERALGELHEARPARAPDADPDVRNAFERRLGRLLLGRQPERLVVTRPLPASLTAARAAARDVLEASPFGLVRPRLLAPTHSDRVALALDLPRGEELKRTQGKRERAAVEESWQALRGDLHASEVRVALHRTADAGCTLVLGVDLRAGLARTTRAMALGVGVVTLVGAVLLGGLLAIVLHEAGDVPGVPALALGVLLATLLSVLVGTLASRLLTVGAASAATQELARAADAVLARVSEEALAPRR